MAVDTSKVTASRTYAKVVIKASPFVLISTDISRRGIVWVMPCSGVRYQAAHPYLHEETTSSSTFDNTILTILILVYSLDAK